VVEPLRGYLMLAEACCAEPEAFSRAFNFGPAPDDMVPVGQLMDRLVRCWPGARWENVSEQDAPHEASFLKLDIALARSRLGWAPRTNLDRALQWTTDWYRTYYDKADAEALRELMRERIRALQPETEE
jgi:CDP-glucose 4,6-dehydratase